MKKLWSIKNSDLVGVYVLYYNQHREHREGKATMKAKDAKTIKKLEKELESVTDPKRRAFIKATINRTLHVNGLPSKYGEYC